MENNQINRRAFFAGVMATAAAAIGGGINLAEAQNAKAKKDVKPPRRSILNFNSDMEYRRLGKTGLWVSAVCMGGHWKRMSKMVSSVGGGCGYCKEDFANVENPDFIKNRSDVLSRCMEMGINYVDACTGEEVLAYAKALKGRRNKMYLGYSWYQHETRNKEYRSAAKLLEAFDQGLKQAGLDYVDVWRMTLPQEGLPDLAELQRVEEVSFEALDKARQQGKARFTGISTHNRTWLKSVIEQYPQTIQVICTPYTANTKELPTDSVFSAIRKFDVGAFGIKPFADNALFKGDGADNSPAREEDDLRARLAIRYILNNPAITAPIPGLISMRQVDNVAKAIAERRKLDSKEMSHLREVSREMWANLRPSHRWLKNWEYV